jgi:opacity protein-like surface antigen
LLADYHGGIQMQYPGRRWRPYASFGIGGANISGTASIQLARNSFTQNISVNTMSYTYGGGIRTMFTDRVGMRFGYEGVTLGKDLGSYGRVLIGLTVQTRPN